MLTPGPVALILGQMAGPFGFLTVTPLLGAIGGGLLFVQIGAALGTAAAWLIPPLGPCLMGPCGILGGSTGLMIGALGGGCLSVMFGWIPCLGALFGILAPCGMYCDQALMGITETLEGGGIISGAAGGGLLGGLDLDKILEPFLAPFGYTAPTEPDIGGVIPGIEDIIDIIEYLLGL